MPFEAPFVLGPFTVDAAGRLRPTEAGPMPAFSLCWRGCMIAVELRQTAATPDVTAMALCAGAGRVPSSATIGTAGRAALFAVLVVLPGLLPQGWRLVLRADYRLDLTAEAELAMPATVVELLCAVTRFLLTAAPYLDLLRESGVEAGGPEAGGKVNTCPG